jgi:hypothetical protein
MELIGSPEGHKWGHKAATRRDLKKEEIAQVHEGKEGGPEGRSPRTAEDDNDEARGQCFLFVFVLPCLAAGAQNPGECTFDFCALREDGCTFDLDTFSRSPARSCGPLSGQWSKPADLRRIFGAGPGIKWCAQCDVSQR